MQSQCSCPKWYDVLDQVAVCALIDKYEAHPVYSRALVYTNPALCAKTMIESRRIPTLSMKSVLRNYLETCRTPRHLICTSLAASTTPEEAVRVDLSYENLALALLKPNKQKKARRITPRATD